MPERRAQLAEERASRPAPDGASAQRLAAAHRAEAAAAAAEVARARSDSEALRRALAARDAELQRLQARSRNPWRSSSALWKQLLATLHALRSMSTDSIAGPATWLQQGQAA